MKFHKRLNSDAHSSKDNDLSIVEFSKMLFKPFCEGFVMAGYGRKTHCKFLLMSGNAKIYEDAFERCREPFSHWIKSESKLFPNQEFKQVKIPVESGKETVGVNDLDEAVQRFSLASDAFLMFGYCGSHKVFKSYAADPSKADAVMYLQLMAMDLWGRKQEAGQ